jgi:hypothetical protein
MEGLVKRHIVFLIAIAAMAAAAVLSPPIPQDPLYHLFADRRTVLGIPNAWNVLSNLAIGIASLLGVSALFAGKAALASGPRTLRWTYAALFIGTLLTSVGSMYYHLAPDNARLVWDRLPLTIVFMALFIAVFADRVSIRAASMLLVPLLAFGAGSVLYWQATETDGAGDLRWYALVQFGTLPAIVLLLLLYPSRQLGTRHIVTAIVAYSIAKGCELADAPIFALGHLVSGHTLKHLVAGLGVACFVAMIRASWGEAPGFRASERSRASPRSGAERPGSPRATPSGCPQGQNPSD